MFQALLNYKYSDVCNSSSAWDRNKIQPDLKLRNPILIIGYAIFFSLTLTTLRVARNIKMSSVPISFSLPKIFVFFPVYFIYLIVKKYDLKKCIFVICFLIIFVEFHHFNYLLNFFLYTYICACVKIFHKHFSALYFCNTVESR